MFQDRGELYSFLETPAKLYEATSLLLRVNFLIKNYKHKHISHIENNVYKAPRVLPRYLSRFQNEILTNNAREKRRCRVEKDSTRNT